jgi:hypothetical protein
MVNYTSPGFMILFSCREGLIGLQQAHDELRSLGEKGKINFGEVDPSEKDWIEESLLSFCLYQNKHKYLIKDWLSAELLICELALQLQCVCIYAI